MCGIIGYALAGRPPNRQILESMCRTLAHRGPDEMGVFADPLMGLGIRRLKVIDLATGSQPIANEDGKITVVFNGEIYNYRELRAALTRRGHKFRSRSDTETIVHLYEEKGPDCAAELDGMFSLAVWDAGSNRLLLATDRLGKKPLYYYHANGLFAFASEIKALLAHPQIAVKTDRQNITSFLSLGYIPAPATPWAGIKKMTGSELLEFRPPDRAVKSRYWELRFPADKDLVELSDAMGAVDEALGQAVEKRLISDVPLGLFLSGGIDSGLVAAKMAGLVGRDHVRAFSIGFNESGYDESAGARKIASTLGINHKVKTVNPQEAGRALDNVWRFLDEPIADPSIIPTLLVSEFARQEVTVALAGDGGDELFGGYPKYVAHKFARALRRLPGQSRAGRPLAKILSAWPGFRAQSKAARFFQGLDFDDAVRNHFWIAPFDRQEVAGLTGQDSANSDWPLASEVRRYSGYYTDSGDALDQMLYLDTRLNLANLYLVKLDRASMACSLETRSPFLDRSMIDVATRIPFKLKVKGLTTKFVLRKVAERYLPAEIARAPKRGFGMPLTEWLRGEWRWLVEETLGSRLVESAGLVDPDCVKQLVRRNRAGRADSAQIWTLIVLHKWYERWGSIDADGRRNLRSGIK